VYIHTHITGTKEEIVKINKCAYGLRIQIDELAGASGEKLYIDIDGWQLSKINQNGDNELPNKDWILIFREPIDIRNI